VKPAVKERESQRDGFFSMLLDTLGSTVATQQKNVNLGYLLWGDFCEFL
jgi:hypothetical protein